MHTWVVRVCWLERLHRVRTYASYVSRLWRWSLKQNVLWHWCIRYCLLLIHRCWLRQRHRIWLIQRLYVGSRVVHTLATWSWFYAACSCLSWKLKLWIQNSWTCQINTRYAFHWSNVTHLLLVTSINLR